MKINTVLLQSMVSRAIKGSGNNKLMPITGLMGISLTGGTLTLTTTDFSNYLFVKESVDGEDFSVTVPVDTFSKLISKLTCDTVEFELTENKLEITGNGKYLIELPFDSDGGIVEFPNPLKDFDFNNAKTYRIEPSTVSTIINSIKPALAVNLATPVYTNYYVGDVVMATDSFKINSYNTQLFEEPKLVSAKMMDLLDVISDTSVVANVSQDSVVFDSGSCVVFGKFMPGIEQYSITAIKSLFDREFKCMCKFSKSEMLQALDRIALFVGDFDDGEITLDFGTEGVSISSKASSGDEDITYLDNSNAEEYTARININLLQTQIKAQEDDTIEMWYNDVNNQSVKLVCGDVVSIIALFQ